jgi:hypothetical protein
MVLWLLTPWTSGLGGAAQPLYRHLEKADTFTKVEIGRDANGKPMVTLTLGTKVSAMNSTRTTTISRGA